MSRGGTRGRLLVSDMVLIIILVGIVVGLLLVSVLSPIPRDEGSPPGNGNEENEGPCLGSADCFEDDVTKVVDGDTLYVGGIKIRLSLVDTPESGQSGFEEARNFVINLCPVGSIALVDQDDYQLYDNYGRMLAVVYCGGKNLNKELLEEGHAVILTQYCDDSEFEDQKWARDYGC
jgi:endonuclease YncB( thermonuclease family)